MSFMGSLWRTIAPASTADQSTARWDGLRELLGDDLAAVGKDPLELTPHHHCVNQGPSGPKGSR